MTDKTESGAKTIAIILAGGAGRRMGGSDKGLINLQGRPLVEYVIGYLKPQVDDILIVANRHHDSYAEYGYPVISDEVSDYPGPLAGMLAGLSHAVADGDDINALFVPVDAPQLPANFASRLLAASESGLSVASNLDGIQPVCCLINSRHLENLREAFAEGERSPSRWLKSLNAASADFSNDADCIWSINTAEELQAAEQTLLHTEGAAA